ncbi:MAG: ABC transporter substrate-binding protein/permease [Oscillospiraceae bacterium]|nr:ABC transporter substrate-binding protein/permease [Oscillospiraceae bacterium]
MFKKIFKIFIFVLFLFCLPHYVFAYRDFQEIKSSKKIKMITNAEFAPFEYIDETGKICGADIDIAQKIAEKMGFILEVESVEFDSILISLQNGSADFALAAITYSDEKAKNASFSNPYFKTTQRIIVPKTSKMQNSKELKEKKIGVVLGYKGDLYCSEIFGEDYVVRYKNAPSAFSDLLNSRIDAFVVDDFTAQSLVNTKPDAVKIINETLTDEEYVIGVAKDNKELLENINKILEELKSSGEIEKFVDENKTKNLKTYKTNENNIYIRYVPLILEGLKNTMLLTLCAVIIGAALGILLAICRLTGEENKKLKILSLISKCYTSIIRGTPIIIQLFLMYYVVFKFLGNKFTAAIIAFGLNSAAYVAEIVRAGIESVGKGQLDASRSLGLDYKTSMINIVIPQALKNVMPALVNEFVSLLKETPLVGLIGLTDLSRSSDVIRSVTYDALTPLLIVAIIYLVIILILLKFSSLVERKLKKC